MVVTVERENERVVERWHVFNTYPSVSFDRRLGFRSTLILHLVTSATLISLSRKRYGSSTKEYDDGHSNVVRCNTPAIS